MESKGTPKVTVAIPARLASTRLPRKVLLDLGGKPVLRHVWECASRMRCAHEVVVLTDSEEVLQAVGQWGGHALMTRPDCQSGTERIVSVLPSLAGDFILNVQGDEPFMDVRLLEALVTDWSRHPADLITPIHRLTRIEDVQNPNRVKVVVDKDNLALYFSRSPIPYVRNLSPDNWLSQCSFWGHIGVYGYRRSVLQNYHTLVPTPLETAESLEQLRFLANGLKIRTLETDYHSICIDTPADLEFARQHYRA